MVLRHEVRVLKRQLHGRVRYRPADRAMLARSAEYFQGGAGVVFSSRPIPCSASIGSSRVASGSVGEPSEVLDVPRSAMRSSSSSSGSPRENRRWGCVRIQGELRGLGISPDQTPAFPH
jgi:hypothetical protein